MSVGDVVYLTEQEAMQRIRECVQEAYARLAEAEGLARTFKLDFYFDYEYGMGGTYEGAEGKWYPSSQSC